MTLPTQGPALAGIEDRWGFSLRLPSSWTELDLHPATRDATLRRLVEERARDEPSLREHRHAFVRALQTQARTAWDAGAVYAACLAQAAPAGAAPAGAAVVSAAVTVSVLRGPVGAREEGDSTAAVLAELGASAPAPRPGDPLEPWRVVEDVELPGVGRCARTRAVEDVRAEGGTVRTATLQTFVPLPGANKLLVVSGSAPYPHLADRLHAVLAAVTATLRIEPGGPAPSPRRKP